MVTITVAESTGRAYRAGVRSGDVLVSINQNEIRDVLDYRFYLTEATVELCLLRAGEPYHVCIHKDEYEDIGLEFETPLMDKKAFLPKRLRLLFYRSAPKRNARVALLQG